MDISETLSAARSAVIEIESIRDSIRSINTRLYGTPSPRFDGERGTAPSGARERNLDRKIALEHTLEEAKARTEDIIDQAERVIELVPNPRKRAAMRYYYICGVKSYEEVAERCCCSVSSVQRWLLKKK